MLVQLDIKFAADEVKVGLMSMDGTCDMDHVLAVLKAHAASGQIQQLRWRVRCMVGRIRTMQGQLHRAE